MRTVYSYEFRTLLHAKRQRLLSSAQAGNELQDVEVALARLADGTYGACVECGAEIDRAQLKADPTAQRCRDCGPGYGER